MFVEIVTGYFFSTLCHSDNVPSWVTYFLPTNGICFIFRGEYHQETVSIPVVSCCSEYEKKVDGTCQSKSNSS